MTFLATDDADVAVFGSAVDAVAAALERQRSEGGGGLRIGLHTGEARLRDDGRYTGAALQRGKRLRDIANLGQTLLSSVTASLVADTLPEGARLHDLGIHRLRDLSQPERLFELRPAGVTGESPPVSSLDAVAHNLPVQLTTFVGRGEELAAVEALIRRERLVTLTGSGGCGKTRLAVQAAAERADRWPDGVWWVELGSVTEPHVVAELVASATGVMVEPSGGPLRALTLQLRDRRMLVCLDNCEHLLDATAEVAEMLLRSCPEMTVLTTSREPLGVASEVVWRVPSLVENDAVALFVERASRVRPWFTLDDTNDAAVRSICRQLDGIPLAVELAAAWVRTLTPSQIASGLDNRFSLLVHGPRGAIGRHQTLAASIEWSHDLLNDTDRLVFRRLAVFAGGFTLDAARAVCAGGTVADDEVLDSLARLVDKSLVVVDERDGDARYRLLETIRQYASDRLDEFGTRAATCDLHLDHYLSIAETADSEILRADQDQWLTLLEVEHDNLRAALEWGLALPNPERGRRLAAAMVWLWYLHGHAHEGLQYLQRALALAPDDRSTLQSKLLSSVAAVAINTAQFDVMTEYAQRALEVATASGDAEICGHALFLLGTVQSLVDFDAAWSLFDQAERFARAAHDPFVTAGVLVLRGTLLASRDRHAEARPLLQEGFERFHSRGDRSFAALALNYQDDAALLTGDVRQANELASRALEIAKPLNDYYTVGLATGHLAFARGVAGDFEGGRRLMEAVVRSVEGADNGTHVPRMAPVMGKLCLWSGDFEAAARWFARDVRHADRPIPALILARSLPGLASALRHMGRMSEARKRADEAVDVARTLGVPHLLAEALHELAMLVGEDDPGHAEDLHHEALGVRVSHGLRLFQVDSLDALAALAARAESHAEAVRLLAASTVAREEMGYPRRPIDQPGVEAMLKLLCSAMGDSAFDAAVREGGALSLDEAVAYVRRARGARGRPSTGWASLTPTERSVVDLVVEGLNNPEIGVRLFMSRGTVKTHLSHVYAKLGVANRTELATLAAIQLARD